MTTKSSEISKNRLDVRSPFDGSLIKTLELQTADEAEQMLVTARRLFQDRDGWLEPDQRIAILQKLSNLVAAEAEDFALLIAQEGGKPLTDARIEVTRVIDGIALAAKELLHVMRGDEVPMGHTEATRNRTAFTRCEPLGVVLAISAFNHPLNLIVHQAIPAVAVGCPVIVKPATVSAYLAEAMVREIIASGILPEGSLQLICGRTGDIFEHLNEQDSVTFTGSASTGRMLKSHPNIIANSIPFNM